MNKIIVVLLFVLGMVILFKDRIFAISASPDPIEITQPDGTKIKIKIKGDEFYHWFEDNDGYTILKDTETKSWVYAIKNNNSYLEKSDKIVGKIQPSSLGIQKSMKDNSVINNSIQKIKKYTLSTSKITTSSIQKTLPSTGTIKNLVILVEFSDKSMEFSQTEIYNLFNKTNYTTDGAVGSVKDFFNEISYNSLNVESIVTDIVTLDNGYAYYGANDSHGDDIRPREMVKEALSKLNSQGFDFTQADSDGDGWVDMLTVLHSGCGEEASSDTNNIWSHRWEIQTTFTTHDNIKLKEYMTVPERRGSESSTIGIIRIGVICHELTHLLYMPDLAIYVPDLYDTSYNSNGLGKFCLMASGSWNGSSGNRPAHPCAWIKYRLGWINTQTPQSGTNTIGPSATSNTAFYKLTGDSFSASEYFLIENRQSIGFDIGLPGTLRGLLIYHIDETQSDNDDRTHYLVDLEEADGSSIWTNDHLANNINKGLDSDYYRNNTVAVFNDSCSSSPNSKSYSYKSSNIDISQISASAATMSFVTPEEENCANFINALTDDKGLKFLNLIMKYSPEKTKTELLLLNTTEQANINKYFTFTTSGASQADQMADVYYGYIDNGIIYDISKNQTGIVSSDQANLINKSNANLSNSLQTIKTIGNISDKDNPPTEQDTTTAITNKRFTGTEAIENIKIDITNLGYLLPEFSDMYSGEGYNIIEITPDIDLSIYPNYVYIKGDESISFDNLSKIVAFPNPSRNGEITFINLPTNTTKLDTRIFTITSQPVKSFTINDTEFISNGNRKLKWDCRNYNGDNVAQGIYFVMFKTEADKKIIKIAIIR